MNFFGGKETFVNECIDSRGEGKKYFGVGGEEKKETNDN